MAGFASIADLVNADINGATLVTSWKKTPTQTTAQGFWFDLSSSPGNPPPQYFAAAPLISVALAQSTDGGIYHGQQLGSSKKMILRRMMAISGNATVVPCQMILCDYLLYYPFIDESTTGPQPLTTITTLPRYTTGVGVKMMAVVQNGQSGGATFNVTYTNTLGQTQTSATVTLNTQPSTGTILTTAPATAGCLGPFIPLSPGDLGILNIQSVNMISSDVGLFALVLVKPLAQFNIRGIDAPTEIDYFTACGGGAPIIQDDAYLNFICNPNGTLAATAIYGIAEFAWN